MSSQTMKLLNADEYVSLPGHDGIKVDLEYSLISLEKYLVNKFGDEEIFIIGHSLGGLMAYQLAGTLNVKGIVGVAIPPLNYHVIEGAVQLNRCSELAYKADISDEEIEEFSHLITDSNDAKALIIKSFKESSPVVRGNFMKSIQAGHLKDQVEILSNAKIPVLLIKGSRDNIINNALFHGHSFAEVMELDAGHMIPMERPVELNKVISDFINKLDM